MAEQGKQGGKVPFGPDYVRAISPYVAGKPISEVAREFGLDEASIVKLASNENPLGMPESARHAVAAAIAELGRYPDSNGFELKAALSTKLGVPQDWLTLGNGSNDILELAAHALVTPGQSVVYAEYSFAVYALATQEIGARAIEVKARDYGHDLEAMAAAIAPDTRLVFIANPNNPTGTFAPAAHWKRSWPRCPPTWPWCWTRRTTNTSTMSSNMIRWRGCAATLTCWYRARSPRHTGWPGCASAMPWRSPS